MASETIDLKLRADISQLQANLAEIPGITEKEATKMVRALDKQLKRAEKSAKKAGQAGKKSFKGMQDSAGEADSVLQGLASGLDLIDPKLGAMARLAGDAAGGMEAMARAAKGGLVVMGALGAALAVAGAAYHFLKQDLDEAEEKQRAAAATADEMSKAYARLEAVLTDVDDQIALATGTIEEWEIKARKAMGNVADAYGPSIKASEAHLRAMKNEALVIERNFKIGQQHRDEMNKAAEAVANAERRLAQLNKTRDDAVGKVELLAFHQNELKKTAEAEAEAEKALTEALRAQKEAAAETAREEADRATQMAERAAAVEQLAQIEAAANAVGLSGVAAIRYERDQELAQIDELATAHENLNGVVEAREAVSGKFWAQEQASIQATIREAEQAEEQVAAFLQGIQDEQSATTMAIAGSVADIAGAAAQVFSVVSEARVSAFEDAKQALFDLGEEASQADRDQAMAAIDASKAAAKKAFNMEKAMSISEALINGAVAVTSALTIPPPAGFVAAAAVSATVAAQVATIAAMQPSFHTGGLVGDPSERMATLRTGEGVLTRQGVNAIGGPSGLSDANRGQGGGSAPIRLELRVGNNVAQEVVYAGTRGPGRGRQATQALRASGRVNPYRQAR